MTASINPLFEAALRAAGIGQFLVLIASALVPRHFAWREAFQPLHPFLRRLFWTYGAFIVLTIAAFGVLTLRFAQEMAAGEPVARGLAAFIALFWGARLFVQFFIFDLREWLTSSLMRLGNHALTLAFIFFTLVYAWTAIF
jgi:hypothetical protein